MHPELEALLVVQRDDARIREITQRRDGLAPRLEALDRTRKRMLEEAQRNDATLARETERHRELEQRIAEHRQRHEKNLAILNQAHRLKEATAAASQVESARRVLADEESELLALSRRMNDLRSAAAANREALEALDVEQASAREEIQGQLKEIEEELRAAGEERRRSASAVPASLFSKYERLYTRRQTEVVFPLRNFSCGNCDTAIPLQRRPALLNGHHIETCEACGVLLYLELPRSQSASPERETIGA